MELFLKNKTFLICGAGRFGSRASEFLSQGSKPGVTVIDHDPEKLNRIRNQAVVKIRADVVDYLTREQSWPDPDSIIIPAVPVHLAFKWLVAVLQMDYHIGRLDLPSEALSGLPHPMPILRHELVCSYADFVCPDDCPEPENICFATGKKRGTPLFELMTNLKPEGFQTGVIRSRQTGPGLGGYAWGELLLLKERIIREGSGKWLIGTACRCHGILSAFEIRIPRKGE